MKGVCKNSQRAFDIEMQVQIEKGAYLRDQEIILNMHEANTSAESIAQLTKIPISKVKEIIDSATHE